MPPVPPRRGEQRRDSRRGSAGTRAPLPAAGAAGGGSGEPPPGLPLRGAASRACPPNSGEMPSVPGAVAPADAQVRRSEDARGGSRVSPALRAPAGPPLPALPIQGSCRQRCSRRRSHPGSPPARRPAGSRGDVRDGDQRSWRGSPSGTQPCEPPASRPGGRGAYGRLLSFPPREPRTKPGLAASRSRTGRGPCACGERGRTDGAVRDGAGVRPRPQADSPGPYFASALRSTRPHVGRGSLQRGADSPVRRHRRALPRGWSVPESGGCHLPRDSGSDKAFVAVMDLPGAQEVKRISSSLWLRKTLGQTLTPARDQG